MSASVWKITLGGTVLVNNLPYAAVWQILQILECDWNLQGLVLAVGP
ncbi:hypothetical protein [Paraburkholderia sediminicola]